MNETRIIHCDDVLDGTLICTVISRKKIYLFSDGRVDREGNIISDEHSKVHKITKFTGMLTAGMYLKPLVPSIITNCKKQDLIFAEDVVLITALVLQEIWNHNLELMERREKEEKMKVFAFVAGYSNAKEPKLYYLESNSNPRFFINERLLFRGRGEFEIGTIVSAETTQDATALMTNNIKNLRKKIKTKKIGKKKQGKVFRQAFDDTKKQINSENCLVGGKTFVLMIDPLFGLQYV